MIGEGGTQKKVEVATKLLSAIVVELQGDDKKRTSYITVKPSSIYVSLSLSKNSGRNSF